MPYLRASAARLASELPGASVAPWRFTRSRFPTLFRRGAAGTFCTVHADGRGRVAWWGSTVCSADISRRPTDALAGPRLRPGRPTYGWRQHPGRGTFSGYRRRLAVSLGVYGVGGERTGSSQSGRRSYQYQTPGVASSVKRMPQLYHRHLILFDFGTSHYYTKVFVSFGGN